jgi:AcrR family transcriptional regulator
MFPEPDPWFRRPWSCDQPDVLTDAAFELIAEGGTPALTMHAVAARTGMSPSWLTDRFTNRARMLAIIASVFGDHWTVWIQARLNDHGLLAMLPTDDDGVVATRVWLALVELGRIEQGVAWRTAAVRRDERAIVARLLGPEATADKIEEVVAVIEGHRAGIADPERPLPPSRASAILRAHA